MDLNQAGQNIFQMRFRIAELEALVMALWTAMAKNNKDINPEMLKIAKKAAFDATVQDLKNEFPDFKLSKPPANSSK